jgi:hypothetical protein
VGFRFGPHLDTAVPLMIQFADKATEGDDELREQCLQVGIGDGWAMVACLSGCSWAACSWVTAAERLAAGQPAARRRLQLA